MAGWLSCHSARVILFRCKLRCLAYRVYRIHGGFRKFRALKRARKRRRDTFAGFGLGAIGGARNIEPKSAPSSAPSAPLRDVEKNAEVISVWLTLPAPPLPFFAGRAATTMNRDTNDGITARVWRKKRDTDFAAWGTRLAICWISRPGSDCKKREPVSVRGDRAPALRGPWPRHPCGAARIRAQARLRAARPRRAV